MSYSLVLLHGSTVLVQLPITTLFQPSSANIYNSLHPPGLIAVDKTWTIKGSLRGTSEANAAQLWTTLVGIVQGTGTNQPNGCRFLDAMSNPVEDISTASSYALFKIEAFSSDVSAKAERQWHPEVNFTLKITGRFRLLNTVKLDQHDSFHYDSAGLLTRTLSGTIETAPGTSAIAQAQTFGLSLPGPQYGYLTNGPGGVDVEKLDEADNRASFTSSYQQVGQALPAGVGPDFSTTVEQTTTTGETTSITTVTARGPGAVAAVASKTPSGALTSSSTKSDPYKLTASGVFVSTKPSQPGRLLVLWSFSISGGLPGAGATERTGQRVAALHVLPITPVRISERVSVEVIGTPTDTDFKMPDALSIEGVLLDGGSVTIDPGHRVQIGTTRAGDRWVAGCTRSYLAATVPSSLPTLIGAQVLRPDSAAAKATTPGKLLAKAGSSGSGAAGGLSLGIQGANAGSGDAKINFGVL